MASLCFSMSAPDTVSNTLYKAVLNRAEGGSDLDELKPLPVASCLWPGSQERFQEIIVPCQKIV